MLIYLAKEITGVLLLLISLPGGERWSKVEGGGEGGSQVLHKVVKLCGKGGI